jgi:hypothetical protein
MITRNLQPNSHTVVQIDNAPPHTGHSNLKLLNQYCDEHRLDIEYITQPAQSPDLNICDLSIFNSLQKRVDHLKSKGDHSILALWDATEKSFEDYPKDAISVSFGHLYANYNECLKHNGDNKYDSPHADVRRNFARGLPLRRCNLSIGEYHLKKENIEIWLQNNT